jgi:hypothetical protein
MVANLGKHFASDPVRAALLLETDAALRAELAELHKRARACEKRLEIVYDSDGPSDRIDRLELANTLLAEQAQKERAGNEQLRELARSLAARVLDSASMHDGSCRECGHQLMAETAPHSEECHTGALLSRARDCEKT